MKKIFLISSVIITSMAVANDPQKKDNFSFYNQCLKPNFEALKKKFNENRPMLEEHAKAAHKHYTEFSKTTEYSLAKNCIGFALLADLCRPRVYPRSHLKYIAQLAAGLYFTTPVVKQVYADVTKKK